MSDVHLEALPRMADFALWATACETALWPAGTFARSYKANRRATIESIIEEDPIANCVPAIMVDRTMWTGSASDLLHAIELGRAKVPSLSPLRCVDCVHVCTAPSTC